MGAVRWRSPRECLLSHISQHWVRQLEVSRLLADHTGCVNTIRWSPDGRQLASGSDDLHVKIWTYEGADNAVRLGQSLRSCHHKNIFDAVFQPYGGDTLVTAALDGRIGTVSLAGGDPLTLHDMSDTVPDGSTSKCCFQPLSNDVFITGGSARYRGKGWVYRTDLRDNNTSEICACDDIASVEFSPVDANAYAVGTLNVVLLCDVRMVGRSAVVTRVPTGAGAISGVKYHPNGLELLAYRRNLEQPEGLVQRIDLSPRGDLEPSVVQCYEGALNHDTIGKQVVYMRDHGVVACGSDDGRVYMWERASGRLVRRMRTDRSVVNCVAPHPSLPVVCISGIDSDVKLLALPPEGREVSAGDDDDPLEEAPSRTRGLSLAKGPAILSVREAPGFIREAEELKAVGTAAVRAKNWQNAINNYETAVERLDFVPPNHTLARARRAVAVACYGNIAHCYMQKKTWDRAVHHCELVLKLDPTNIKALYRKAVSLGERGDFAGAIKLCQSDAAKGNADFTKLLPKLQEKQKQAAQKEKDKYKAMFN